MMTPAALFLALAFQASQNAAMAQQPAPLEIRFDGEDTRVREALDKIVKSGAAAWRSDGETVTQRPLVVMTSVEDSLRVTNADGTRVDTIPAPPDATTTTLENRIRLVLASYLAHTPWQGTSDLRYTPPKAKETASDPWKGWVMSARVQAFGNGESSRRSLFFSGRVGADKVTAKHKTSAGFSFNRNERRFDLSTGRTTSTTSSNSVSLSQIFGVSDHWSIGAFGSTSTNSFSNISRSTSVEGGVEYDLFPYSESTKRRLTAAYRAGVRAARYEEETIFLATRETIGTHGLTISWEQKKERWTGDLRARATRSVVKDRKTSLNAQGSIELNLVAGLSVNFFGSYTKTGSQETLPRRGASREEVLLRQREIASAARHFFQVSLAYRFGSKKSNVINPRFGN